MTVHKLVLKICEMNLLAASDHMGEIKKKTVPSWLGFEVTDKLLLLKTEVSHFTALQRQPLKDSKLLLFTLRST